MRLKLGITTLLLALLVSSSHAECSKSEVMKLIDKGFSKTEINSICDIQAKSSTKPKPKSKWITPSNSICRAKGGKIVKGVCKANWQQAKAICHANNGRLPTRGELTQVIEVCGGVVANHYSDGSKRWNEKLDENRGDPNYQSCYKQKGFYTSDYYWSSSSYVSNDKDAWVMYFKDGSTDYYDKTYDGYVCCVRGRR